MTAVPPSGTELGVVEVVETYVYVDGPRFFLAQNRAGQYLLGLSVHEEEASDYYLYLQLSVERLQMIRSGGVSVREAFLSPENGQIAEVRIDYVEDLPSPHLAWVHPEQVDPEWLPTEGAALSLPTETRPQFDPSRLQNRSVAEARSLFAVRLRSENYVRTEYSVRPLGEILTLIQDNLDAQAQELGGEVTRAGRLPDVILQDAEMSLVDIQAASFVLVLSPTVGKRLVELPLARQAAERLMDLLDESGDLSNLRTALPDLGVRSVSKLRDLVEEAVDQGVGLDLYLAEPSSPVRHSAITLSSANRALSILQGADETIEERTLRSATLVGVNQRTKRFELFSQASDEAFSGRIDERAAGQIEGLTIGERYDATIRVETSFSSYTSEVKKKYRLLSIESPEPPSRA